jgi:hypothetical protein
VASGFICAAWSTRGLLSFSDSSPELFSYAVSWANENEAGILVLHVVSRWAVWKGRVGALWAGVSFNKKWARIKWDTCEKMKYRMAQFFAGIARMPPFCRNALKPGWWPTARWPKRSPPKRTCSSAMRL